MEWNDLIPLLQRKPWTYRLKIIQQPLSTDWSSWLIAPVEGYIEAEQQGPYPARQIEWIDIDPIETKSSGRLMPATETDHSDEVAKLLKACSLPHDKDSSLFRIFISPINVDPM